jgi:hypothetical protein
VVTLNGFIVGVLRSLRYCDTFIPFKAAKRVVGRLRCGRSKFNYFFYPLRHRFCHFLLSSCFHASPENTENNRVMGDAERSGKCAFIPCEARLLVLLETLKTNWGSLGPDQAVVVSAASAALGVAGAFLEVHTKDKPRVLTMVMKINEEVSRLGGVLVDAILLLTLETVWTALRATVLDHALVRALDPQKVAASSLWILRAVMRRYAGSHEAVHITAATFDACKRRGGFSGPGACGGPRRCDATHMASRVMCLVRAWFRERKSCAPKDTCSETVFTTEVGVRATPQERTRARLELLKGMTRHPHPRSHGFL